jgi:hypothetical protein
MITSEREYYPWQVLDFFLDLEYRGKSLRELYFTFSRYRHHRSFVFNGALLPYLISRYNSTWNNERTVEVPIVLALMGRGPKHILEVGNVLCRYVNFSHDVVDKYERGAGVINSDIVSYTPFSKYDLVVSISTFEHIGYDEPEPRNANKILDVIENLRRNCLSPGGAIIFTVPLGPNYQLDRYIFEGILMTTELFYMKRVSRDNEWLQVSVSDVSDSTYGKPFPGGNAVAIGVIRT